MIKAFVIILTASLHASAAVPIAIDADIDAFIYACCEGCGVIAATLGFVFFAAIVALMMMMMYAEYAVDGVYKCVGYVVQYRKWER
ncbi:hypothetical protein Daesc_009593 [Daldinia eschscholtzii]|uniref:Uncharacterized protein n=1 Tax=Daldinia eschscholtzii TaxID=292717 RepID=A0AAX6MBF2_9PEZI